MGGEIGGRLPRFSLDGFSRSFALHCSLLQLPQCWCTRQTNRLQASQVEIFMDSWPLLQLANVRGVTYCGIPPPPGWGSSASPTRAAKSEEYSAQPSRNECMHTVSHARCSYVAFSFSRRAASA